MAGKRRSGGRFQTASADGSEAGTTATEWTVPGSWGGRADESAPPADPEAVARLICLRLLAAAPRTRAELAKALRRRNVPEAAAAAVLDRFTEVKLIDDAMFASAWVESRHHGRGLARRALAVELGQRGVDSDDIKEAMSQLTPEQELATARALVRRKLASTAGQPSQVRIRRLAGMLARKGYSPGLAYRVVREELSEEASVARQADGVDAAAALDDFELFTAQDDDADGADS